MKTTIWVDQAATKIVGTATALHTAIEHNPEWKQRQNSEAVMADLEQCQLFLNGIMPRILGRAPIEGCQGVKVARQEHLLGKKEMQTAVNELEGAADALTTMVDGLKKQPQLANKPRETVA